MTNQAQLTANNKHPLALRHYLLSLLLGFFLFVGLLTVVMVYWGAQQSIAQFSAQFSEQVSKTAEVKLSRFFASGIALAKTNQDALATGLVSLDDKIALQQLFVSEIKSFPYKTFISAADRNGEYVGATRTPDTDDIQIMTATLKNDRMLTFYALGKDNLLGERLRSVRKSDQRDRPWYQQALRTQKLGWYPVYKYLPYKGLGIGVVAPIFSRQTGAFDGVITVDLALDHVSGYLRTIDVGENGLSFLVDDQGKLAATSLPAPVYTGEAAQAVQLTLSNYPDVRLQAIANIVQPQGQFNLRIEGRDYVLHKRVIQDDYGLYFVVGVLLATEDFDAGFYHQLIVVVFVLLIMILLGLLMVRYLSYQLVKPIELLIERVACDPNERQPDLSCSAALRQRCLSEGGHPCLTEQSQIVEVNQLAAAFNRSSEQIQTGVHLLEQRVAERTAALAAANQQLERLSNTDGLTGIANRRYFDEQFAQMKAFAQRSQLPLSVLMLDIDWFKLYNDHYGHIEGDDCLKQVAHALQQQVYRQSDLVARYGGEEFVVLLFDTDAPAAQLLAERMVHAVRDLHLPHAMSAFAQVSISIGVASWSPKGDQTIASLLDRADTALYEAKQHGRNRYCSMSMDCT
jgi:diguanylate cyclase (GGDEF)-like protein